MSLRWTALLSLALSGPAVGAVAASALTAAELRGQQLYLSGRSDEPPAPTAKLSAQGQPIPATLLPCANCHGAEGRGGFEGGVQTADLRPVALQRPLLHGPRRRPAYTAELLKRAITQGFDAGGSPLGRAMPRYQFSQAAIGDLLAWLAVLGRHTAPGLSTDTLQIRLIGADRLKPPEITVYGRRIVVQRDPQIASFCTIDVSADGSASLRSAEAQGQPTLVLHAGGATTGPHGFQLLQTGSESQLAALRGWARFRGLRGDLLNADCSRAEPEAPLLLVTAAVADRCAPRLDHAAGEIVIAADQPPDSDWPETVAAASLAIAVQVLQQLGREPTQSAFIQGLERFQTFAPPGLPALRWSADQHVGARAAWLMQLDRVTKRWLAEPGWIQADS